MGSEPTMAVIQVLGQPSPGERHLLGTSPVTVLGRDSTCDITLKKSTISRHHTQIVLVRGKFYVEDAGSTNGTFVNGVRIKDRVTLKDGDRISLFDVPLVFFLDDHQPQQSEQTERFVNNGKFDGVKTDSSMKLLAESVDADVLKQRLDSLIEITRYLGTTLDPEVILPRVMDLLFTMFPQTVSGEIDLVDAKGNLQPVALKLGRDGDSTLLTGPQSHTEMTEGVFRTGEASIHSTAPVDDSSILDSMYEYSMCVPIVDPAENRLGVMLLVTDEAKSAYRDQDLDMTALVGVLAGQALSFSRAHAQMLNLEKSQREMETARTIQRGLLPSQRPQVTGYAFCDYYATAEKVGGDFYFYQTLPDSRVIVGIADAAGKGLGAAMHVVRFAGEVRFRLATSSSLKAALSDINRFVYDVSDGTFITCCVCVIDPQQHEVSVVNAGHMAPLRRHGVTAKIESLECPRGSMPLGVDPDTEFHPTRFKLKPRDSVLLYTDGASEAMNEAQELYGIERLTQTLAASHGSVNDCVDAVVADVFAFRDGYRASDDTCIVSFGRMA